MKNRVIIPNDTKLFSQADCEQKVKFYLSSDSSSKKIYDVIKSESNPKFEFIDLSKPYNEYFGVLDL